jgi:hypothetical protein
LVLFGVLVGTPLVLREMSSDSETSPLAAVEKAEKSAPAPEKAEPVSNSGKVTMDGMPPQPTPAEPSKGPALDELNSIDNTKPSDSEPPPPPAGNSGGGSSMGYHWKDAAPEPTLMGDKDCPSVDMAGEYDPRIETQKNGDTFVMPASELPKMTLDGGGGADTLKVSGGGTVDADGVHLKRIEIYDLRNSQPNTLRVFAQGLASMDGHHAIVVGDKDGDAVELDPCLEWNDPIAIEDGPEPLLRYDAHDKHGNQASVSVTEGVKVVKPAAK